MEIIVSVIFLIGFIILYRNSDNIQYYIDKHEKEKQTQIVYEKHFCPKCEKDIASKILNANGKRTLSPYEVSISSDADKVYMCLMCQTKYKVSKDNMSYHFIKPKIRIHPVVAIISSIFIIVYIIAIFKAQVSLTKCVMCDTYSNGELYCEECYLKTNTPTPSIKPSYNYSYKNNTIKDPKSKTTPLNSCHAHGCSDNTYIGGDYCPRHTCNADNCVNYMKSSLERYCDSCKDKLTCIYPSCNRDKYRGTEYCNLHKR